MMHLVKVWDVSLYEKKSSGLFIKSTKEALLKGEHMRKENYGLVIRVTWELFKVPVKILELVRQITWSKGNRYAK